MLTVAYSYEELALRRHNQFRAIHNAQAMTLNSHMNQQAASYARRIARRGSLQHSSSSERPGQGENLAMACSTNGLSAEEAVDNWYTY